mmetsp:Transcript_72729/g.117974  ORF Transcript_72729/g.117974 Transcript_72729/m.117974 type:complete len:85 (-) Transcript_72729:1136-1390(-)
MHVYMYNNACNANHSMDKHAYKFRYIYAHIDSKDNLREGGGILHTTTHTVCVRMYTYTDALATQAISCTRTNTLSEYGCTHRIL